MDSSEWKALNAISICRTLVAGFFWLFVPLYMFSAHLPPADIGLAIAIGTLIRLFTAPFIGTLNDLLGTRRLMQASLLGMSLGSAGLALTAPATLSLAVILFPLCLFLLSNNSLMLSLEASLYKKTTNTQVAGHVGEYNAFKALAWGIGILISGYLMLTYPFNDIAGGLSVFCLLVLGLTVLVQHTVRVEFDLARYRRELGRPMVLVLSILIFIQSFEWGTEGVVLSPLYSQQAGLDSAQMGLVTFGANLAVAIASVWVGRSVSARRKGAQPKAVRGVLLSGLLFAAAGSFLIFFVHDLAGMLAARVIYNLGEVLIGVSFGYLIGTLFSQSHVGGTNGVLNLISNAGIATAALAAGAFMGFGLGVPYLMTGMLFLCAIVLVWFSVKRL